MAEALDGIVAEVAAGIAARAGEIEAKADAKDPDAAPGGIGLAVATLDGRLLAAGATDARFPIQSISKVFALELALCGEGDRLFERVGREPSGDPFNSMVDLERNQGIPRNPFINAGALLVVDVLVECLDDDAQARTVADFVTRQAGDGHEIGLDDAVLATLHEGGDLNRAMTSFMRHHGNLRSDPEEVMEAYVHQCAIELDCRALACAGRFLARTARVPDDQEADERARRMRKVLALMMTCGNYDGSGDFAMRVGLPAKSGVGGGILAIVPGVAAVAAWSPNLDQNGNSILGVHALEQLCDRTGWSAFGPALV